MNRRNFFLKNIKKMLDNAKHLQIKNIKISRPHPVLLSNVPIILVYQEDESYEMRSGSHEYLVDTYNAEFNFTVDVLMKNTPGIDLELNDVASKIEDEFIKDIYFEKITGEKQGDNNGLKISNSKPYTFDDGAENSYAAVSTTFGVQYIVDGIPDIRVDQLEGLDGNINRVGYDDNTVDPTLSEIKVNNQGE